MLPTDLPEDPKFKLTLDRSGTWWIEDKRTEAEAILAQALERLQVGAVA